MPNLSPSRTIVLFIDIDDTLIVKDLSTNDVEFCGAAQINDASHWVALLTRLQEKCSALDVHFMVQIVSAKNSCNVDCTVDAVATHLHAFLQPPHMKQNDLDGIQRQYVAMFHAYNKVTINLCDNYMVTGTENTQLISGDEILPSIHLCQKNAPDGNTSKAKVMGIVNSRLGGIPGDQLFLLDDSDGWEDDLRCSNQGYQFISASSLRATSQKERAVAFQSLQEKIETRIIACATSLKYPSQTCDENKMYNIMCQENKAQTRSLTQEVKKALPSKMISVDESLFFDKNMFFALGCVSSIVVAFILTISLHRDDRSIAATGIGASLVLGGGVLISQCLFADKNKPKFNSASINKEELNDGQNTGRSDYNPFHMD